MNSRKKNVILTGPTGILGSYVLYELVKNHPDTQVHYLVRAGSKDEGRERVRKIIQLYTSDPSVLERFHTNAHPLIGDMCLPLLGLSQEEFQEISSSPKTIIHCAANTNLFMPYEKIRDINVGGSKNIIAAAKIGKHDVLNVSSYSVFAENLFKAGARLDEFMPIDFDQKYPLFGGYAKSKLETEMLFRETDWEESNWCNLRAGNIFGESETGYYPFAMASVNNFFYEIMASLPTVGFSARVSNYFDISPVDYVARAVVCFLKHGFHPGQNYHLVNPHRPKISDLVTAFRELGHTIEVIEDWNQFMDIYKGKIKDPNLKESVKNKLNLLLVGKDVFQLQNTCADADWTYKFLEAQGVHCPKVDTQLVQKMYKHYQAAFSA